MLATAGRHGNWWKCRCGAQGDCWGSPTIGWAKHVGEAIRGE